MEVKVLIRSFSSVGSIANIATGSMSDSISRGELPDETVNCHLGPVMEQSKDSKRKQDEDSDSDVVSISHLLIVQLNAQLSQNFVDVDFDFFDPNAKVDYHSLKRLLIQLFQSDAELFHLHELTELILSQPNMGTTIKTDGIDSDPYAFLTVLNMHVHQVRIYFQIIDISSYISPPQDHPSIKALREYILRNSSSDPSFHSALQSLLDPSVSTKHVGLVICERLVNMPVQVVPPMYRMLSDELKWAVEDVNITRLLFRFFHSVFKRVTTG